MAVAACFTASDEAERSAFDAFAVEWMANRDERCGVNVFGDLGREPRIEEGGAGVVRVVFEATRHSRYWKDALVYFTTDAKQAATATFKGFFDLVADEYHPASLRL